MKIRHIGHLALCNGRHYENYIGRIDLGPKRYERLGVKERFKDEAPYRVCRRCIGKLSGQTKKGKRK